MYDTKSRELRWNATYSDYASTLPDDDTKYSKAPQHSGSSVASCFGHSVSLVAPLQKWLTLCPMGTGWLWLWTAIPEMSSGSRTTTHQWWLCTSGSVRVSAKFLTLTLLSKRCVTSPSCPERLDASLSGNIHFQRRQSPQINSCNCCFFLLLLKQMWYFCLKQIGYWY